MTRRTPDSPGQPTVLTPVAIAVQTLTTRPPSRQRWVQGLFAGECEPVEVLSADPDHIALKIGLDDFQLAAHLRWREVRSPVLAQHDPADVVADTSSLHTGCQSRLTKVVLSI